MGCERIEAGILPVRAGQTRRLTLWQDAQPVVALAAVPLLRITEIPEKHLFLTFTRVPRA